MVDVSIVVEGGAPVVNATAATVDNSNLLREAFYSILTEALGRDDVSIVISMGTGNRAAAKEFVRNSEHSYMFTDLDRTPDKKTEWFICMETDRADEPIVIPEDKVARVFFMIQEMEAWLLKQPAAIEQWADLKGLERFEQSVAVAEHPFVKGENVEMIAKPSDVLKNILKATYKSGKLRGNGKPKGLEYGKLKTAPGMLKCLSVSLLISQDQELQRFCEMVNTDYPVRQACDD